MLPVRGPVQRQVGVTGVATVGHIPAVGGDPSRQRCVNAGKPNLT